MIPGSCASWLSAPFAGVKFHRVWDVRSLLIFLVAIKANLLSLACPKWTLRSGLQGETWEAERWKSSWEQHSCSWVADAV